MPKRLRALAIACLAATSTLASTPDSVVLDVKGMDCATCPVLKDSRASTR